MHLGDFEKNIGLMPVIAVNVRCYRTVLKMCQKDIKLVKAKFHYASLFGAGSELVRSWLRTGSEHASDQIPLRCPAC